VSAPKVFDLFMFRGGEDELAMLECRLREFSDLDAWHVVTEATTDHRGNPKPLWFDRAAGRFTPWAHRIIYVPVTDLPADESAWAAGHGGWALEQARRGPGWVREHIQRDRGWEAVEHMAADSDVILTSDLDEFPSPQALEGTFPVAALSQRLAMYAVDWVVPDPHLCSVVASGRYMRGRRASEVRDGRYGYHVIEGGWHLTWLGGLPGQRAKLEATCHTEMRPDEIDRIASGDCYRTGIHHAGDLQLLGVDVDETWPRWIRERRCPESWWRPR
jgi:Glycosyltransferase family 17